tara:strand:- start:11076 stop:11777 length:702 start_codon:yes stop_codon:yes gene_type:complete
MLQKDEFVLVLGSKPGSKLPNLKVKKIYTANGAAEKGSAYIKKYADTKVISIVGGREFEKNLDVQNRVLNSNIDEIVSRSGFVPFKNYNFLKKPTTKYLTLNEQIKFQSNFFKFGKLNILLAEFFYENTFLMQLKHLINFVRKGMINGVSTGFFAILYALKENDQSKVIISGIGMQGGGHFYSKNTTRYSKRANVDKKLIFCLKKIYKDRLYTIDKELEKNANIKYLDIKTFE